MNNIFDRIQIEIKKGKYLWWNSVFSGVLIGFNAPGFGTQSIGLLAFFPLLLSIDAIQQQQVSRWKKILKLFLLSWLAGGISASIAAYWITNSAHVYGHMPWILALLITGLAYGLEVGIQIFVYYSLPSLFFRKSSGWELLLRFTFILAIDPWYPRLIHWNYGGLTFSNFPLMEQVADLIGSGGMIVFSAGFTFLLLALWRWKTEKKGNSKALLIWSLLYVLLWIFALGYGFWKSNQLENISTDSIQKTDPEMEISIQKTDPEMEISKLNLMVIQPNFSLQNLASNPDLAHSTRQNNLNQLLDDSIKALSKIPESSTQENLLIWPESVYPDAFFKESASRNIVLNFAQKNQTYILLTTIDWKFFGKSPKFYGTSVLVSPKGNVVGRYNKKFLIPFGETIPFSNWFPSMANWLRNNISNLSEFEPGDEYTVFPISKNIRISTPICFDIFAPEVAREMVKNGANLILNLSNLAWFGQTTASDNMVAVLKWRAIENRVPLVFASNNGESVIIGITGQPLSHQLPLFEEGIITQELSIQSHYSFYRENAEWVWGFFGLLFLLSVTLAHFQAHVFENKIQPE